MQTRYRRRLTGRTNLREQVESQLPTKKQLAKEKKLIQRQNNVAVKDNKVNNADEEKVDNIIHDLRTRFLERGSMSEAFLKFDENHSGNISSDEFKNFLGHLGYTLDDNQLEILLEKADRDHSNHVDFDEFCLQFSFFRINEESGPSNVNETIGEIGLSRTGKEDSQENMPSISGSNEQNISSYGSESKEHDEIARVNSIISQLKRKVAQKGSMRTVFREYDANHDGSISRDEFRAALNNLNLQVTDKELDALLSMVDSHHSDNKEIMYDDFCAKFADDPSALPDETHALPDFTAAKYKAAALTPKLSELATKLQSGSGFVCYSKMLRAFRDFDPNKEGFLALEDFRLAIDRVSRLGATTGISSSVSWEAEVDSNGGFVDYVAFVERLRQAGISKSSEFFTPSSLQLSSFGSKSPSYDYGDATSPWANKTQKRPTRFQASLVHRYKNTSYITVPTEGCPSYVGNEERLKTIHQSGIIDVFKQDKNVPSAKVERIRKNQARIENHLKEKANKLEQQEASRIECLSIQRQRYLDRVQQASFQRGRNRVEVQQNLQAFSLG